MSSLPPVPAIGPLIRVIPVIVIVVLLTPMWVTCAFLSEARRQFALQILNALAQWARGDMEVGQQSANARLTGTGSCPQCAQAINSIDVTPLLTTGHHP